MSDKKNQKDNYKETSGYKAEMDRRQSRDVSAKPPKLSQGESDGRGSLWGL